LRVNPFTALTACLNTALPELLNHSYPKTKAQLTKNKHGLAEGKTGNKRTFAPYKSNVFLIAELKPPKYLFFSQRVIWGKFGETFKQMHAPNVPNPHKHLEEGC
jgi:hypothetical protein